MSYQPPTDIISKVGQHLREEIGETPHRQQLIKLEALLFDLATHKADWGMLLAEKKAQYLYPKDALGEKKLTDLDRKVMLNANVANIERDYDFLCMLYDLCLQRIAIIKQLLNQD